MSPQALPTGLCVGKEDKHGAGSQCGREPRDDVGLVLQAARLVGKRKAEGIVAHMPRALRKTLRAQGACVHCELFVQW